LFFLIIDISIGKKFLKTTAFRF